MALARLVRHQSAALLLPPTNLAGVRQVRGGAALFARRHWDSHHSVGLHAWPRASRRLGRARERTTASDFRIARPRSEEHTSELQSRVDLVCRLLLEKKKDITPDFLISKKKKIKQIN